MRFGRLLEIVKNFPAFWDRRAAHEVPVILQQGGIELAHVVHQADPFLRIVEDALKTGFASAPLKRMPFRDIGSIASGMAE